MAAIRLATAAVVRGFQGLKSTLNEASTNHELARLIDSSALEDEVGRFRVWAGNLGALQKGHSSADYRLRDSPLLASNAQKLLKELDNNLTESIAVLSGQRLPYEQQVESLSSDGDEEDGFYSDEEDDSSEPGAPKSELEQRFRDIVDIIDNLYKLSVRIRQPTLRTRSLKAASYQPKDPETGVDILDQYAAFDLQHTKELVTHLRASHTDDVRVDGDCLVERLAKAITLRRRQFKYWQRHRAKLGHSTLSDEVELSHQLPAAVQPMVAVQRNDTLEVNVPTVHVPPLPEAVSERTGKTLLSGTEATHHHQSLDDIVDSKSVTSYATTVRDLSGKGIELPPPPKAAAGEKDFECPYCFVICPARYGRGRPWRTHLLQDLQPYLCTYAECEVTGQLFRSRREWSDHEASHRKAWRCPEHPHAVYKSRSGLAEHLDREHAEKIPQSQLESIIKIGETSTVDIRDKCPICFAVADMEGLGGLQNHIAHHLERIASFSLPTLGQDEDADGGSSIASRGGSESTDWSQGLRTESSEFSFKANSTGIKESELLQNLKETSGPQHNVTPVKGTLSAETLSNLPDSSQKRLDLFLPTMSENETEDDQEEHEDTSGLEEHMAEADAFRAYLLSLPGAQSVRFYRRFGSWRGRVTFVNEASAIEAMELRNSDKTRFPDVKMRRRVANNKACLRFDIPSTSKPVEQTPGFVTEDDASVSTMSLDYNEDSHPRNASPLLSVNEIPTLRSLYRSGALVQKDQSHGPSDSYNGIISMCLYDITRLQVDCIVNSANRAMKVTRTNDSLNLFLHSAAGPELNAECRRLGRVRTGNVRLTAGYLLPCNYVIHAARPQYSTAIKHTSKLNLLAACYRNAMHTAMVQGIKTIAFPCLGAGGCGFPSRVAARIALQEVREFLDTHTDHTFERIIFCVYNRTDQKCYEHFLPVFFPPTRGDLENAVIDAKISDYSVLIEQLDSTNMQVDEAVTGLLDFRDRVSDFPNAVLSEMAAIPKALQALRAYFESAKEPILNLTRQIISDIELLCTVLQLLSGSVNEIVLQANSNGYSSSHDDKKYKRIWDEYNFLLDSTHGMDLLQLLQLIRHFIQAVGDILVRGADESPDLGTIRLRLSSYRLEKRGEGDRDLRVHFDTVLYAREYQTEAPDRTRTNIVKAHAIPSLLRLYQLGELEPAPTKAAPSSRQLSTISFIREDITNLEVDAIVNVTDTDFGGVGMLDRTVFRKGGPSLTDECRRFGTCKEGDVKITLGHSLPSRHVIHAIRPKRSNRSKTKIVLDHLYRDILSAALTLKAKTIALPAIGSAGLNHHLFPLSHGPQRECAEVAMEAVKHFLESTDTANSVAKIVFCVYNSYDEEIYKSLLPIYFPPLDMNANKALPEEPHSPGSSPKQTSSSLPESTKLLSKPRRNLFGSLGEAFRSVRFGKQPGATVSRSPLPEELTALTAFEDHASGCEICNDVASLYREGKSLCPNGYSAAQSVLKHLYMDPNHQVYAHNQNGTRVLVELPRRFERTWILLTTVEQSYRDEDRSRPFVSPNQHWTYIDKDPEETPPPGVTVHTAEVTLPLRRGPEEVIATIHTWSHGDGGTHSPKELQPVSPNECSVQIYPGRAEVYDMDPQTRKLTRLLALELTYESAFVKSGSLDVALRAPFSPESEMQPEDDLVFRSRTPAECEMLFQKLKHARQLQVSQDRSQVEEESDRTVDLGYPHPASNRSTETNTLGQDLETARLDVPSVPTYPPRRKSSGFFSLFSQKSEDRPSSSQSKAETAEEPVSPQPSDDTTSGLPQRSISREFLAQADRMLEILRTTQPPEARVPLEAIAKTLQVELATVSELTAYLADLGLVTKASDDLVWAPAQKSRPDAGHEQLQRDTKSARQNTDAPPPSDSTAEPTASHSSGLQSTDIDKSFTYLDRALGTEELNIPPSRDRLEQIPPRPPSAGGETVPEGYWICDVCKSPNRIDLSPTQCQCGHYRGPCCIEARSLLPPLLHGHWVCDICKSPNNIERHPKQCPCGHERGNCCFEAGSRYPGSDNVTWRSATPTASAEARSTRPASDVEDSGTGVYHPRPTSPDHDQPLPIPPGARWTKIDRKIVSAQALEEANERFELRENSVIVLRVLSRGEIKRLADRTLDIRKKREELKELARSNL